MWKYHFALAFSSIFFGINFWMLKYLMPEYFSPEEIIFLRIIISTVLFWIIAETFYPQKTDKKDIWKLAICSLLGISINQILFIEGINFTNPDNASIIQLINPVIVVVFASIILKERLTNFKIAGVIAGLIGTALLLSHSKQLAISDETFKGDMLILGNATVYAFYLIMMKPLMPKYNIYTIMKWVFLFGLFVAFFYSYKHIQNIPHSWSAAPLYAKLFLLYIIFVTTFLTYLLIGYALKKLDTGVTSYYIYIQPITVILIGIILGQEFPDIFKLISILLIFIGVFLVSKKKVDKK